MRYYTIKFVRIIKETDKAICLERWCDKGIVWLPRKCIRENTKYTKGIAYIVPEWLCEDKGLDGKLYEPYNRPQKIEPVYNQEAIDDLKL